MSLVIKGQFGLIVDAVREKRPVIHHLTNYVTAGDCANITLCAGASPVMADEAEEVAEITSNADALVLNLGTIAKAKMQAMETAAAAVKIRHRSSFRSCRSYGVQAAFSFALKL
ncbi:MAG: hydroxyethylthiazole kinase [Phascolarctobacterium faecium]